MNFLYLIFDDFVDFNCKLFGDCVLRVESENVEKVVVCCFGLVEF